MSLDSADEISNIAILLCFFSLFTLQLVLPLANDVLHRRQTVIMLHPGHRAEASDVVLETRVLVSRRLEDENESLGLGLGS